MSENNSSAQEPSKLLIGVVGLNGSGKDTLANYLVEKHGFFHIDLGEEIRSELKRLGRNHLDREEMRALGNKLREEKGNDYWIQFPLKLFDKKQRLVITSLRNPAEVTALKALGGVVVEPFADINKRYQNTVNRVKNNPNEHGDVASFEEFKSKEDMELSDPGLFKQQNLKCIQMADYRVDNNSDLGGFLKNIEEVFQKIASAKNIEPAKN
jgi:dephospho-CoA kinase